MKRLIALVLSLVMALSLCAPAWGMMPSGAGTGVTSAALTGSGTEADPYLIEDLADLKAFRDSVNAGETTYNAKGVYLALNADIDLNNEAWTPIGTSNNYFKGVFDGRENTVSNLMVNDKELSYVGLFGYARGGATIKNVNVHNVNLTGYSQVGSIAGRVYTGSISNCHVTGSIQLSAVYAYAGGITGGDYVQLSDCSVIADTMGEIIISEKTGAGGICGWHTEGNYTLSNCHVKNLNISAWTNLGGITGFVHYENTIDGCSVENVTLTKTRVEGHPGIGMAAGGWSYNKDNAITITNNNFKNITFNGTAVAIESANILYGSEYYGNTNSNFVLENNTQENITNNLIFGVAKAADLVTAVANAEPGDTITILKDITLDETLTIDKALTIDGNGYKITGTIAAADGYKLTEKDDVFTVEIAKADTEKVDTEVKVEVAAPEVSVEVEDTDNETVTEIVEALTKNDAVVFDKEAQESALEKAAVETTAVVKNEISAEKVTEALADANIPVTAEDDVTIVVQPYYDIAVKDVVVKTQGEGSDATVTSASIKLEITPMYQTVATTADLTDANDKIILDKEDGVVNAVAIGEAKEMTVTEPVTITVIIPSALAISDNNGGYKPLYVTHEASKGTYVYEATVTDIGEDGAEAYIATFTNPHGFSSFTLSVEDTTVAKVGNDNYASLQDAINNAGKNATITVIKGDNTAVVKGETSFKVVLENGATAKITADAGYNLTGPNSNGVYTVTKVSGGYYPYIPPTTSTDKLVESAQTFDGGIALSIGVSILSVTGSAWLLRKKED